MRRYRVAIIGCGIGRRHMEEGYLGNPARFEVVAVCDRDPERLRGFAADYGIARAVTDFAAVLAMPDVDVIDICTPPAAHLEQVLAALAAGREVVCEKPLVGCLRDVDRVIAAEAQSRGRVMPIFQYRYGDGFQKARRIIALGLAGDPFLATVETAWRRAAAYYAVPWRGRYDTELGGTLLAHAIHSHDLLCELMGPVETVYAATASRVHPIEVEDCAVGSLRMRSGALASVAATVGSQREITRLRLCFREVTFESSLGPYDPGADPWAIIPASEESAARIAAALAEWQPVPPRFTGQMHAYALALDSGGPLPVTLEDARRSLELLTALYHSAETATQVSLPLPPDHPKYACWAPSHLCMAGD
ncbi:Gfo/Idh/MocA family oxidoreductase [Roseomonas sp. E05]|uniref:Gfo/Idh/MocA family protein n=1 Tax=Roseomonas sp. E05 TaxID=3046310 RepID=UPI0024BB21B2|nr:Gfo/Idh/MocA family oxidoreductase [Roseomonas sp. E05]MDJ0388849.1 Gfo/Idh/MocA family oxidoreductase [Roseomonas sp. E05]